jgi:lipase
LLAVHGVTGHGGRYRALAERGLPERRWLAVDLRGHGHSDWRAPWTTEQHVADLWRRWMRRGSSAATWSGTASALLATHLAATAPERCGQGGAARPGDRAERPGHAGGGEETRHDEGWASEAEGPAARAEGRPPQALPFVEADLDEVLERGEDGRYRLRYCRSTVVTAWSEMARPPAALGGFGGELLLVPACMTAWSGRRWWTRSGATWAID